MTRTAFKAIADVPLERLLLDLANPRIRAGTDQPDCIARLLRKPRQLMALAKDIALNGLSTAPILVQPVKGRKYIVWDGNRRVAALKLLNDPALCGNKALQAQLEGVVAKAAAPIMSAVDVLASKDEDALLKEVLARHAGGMEGVGQLNWDPLLRTLFLLGHKSVPKDYRLAGLLLMWAEEHDIPVQDDFPISTVHRFLNKKNLERLGFRDDQSAVVPTIDKDLAIRIVERIVDDLGSEMIKVENVFDADLQNKYIDSILAELGRTGGTSGAASGSPRSGGEAPSDEESEDVEDETPKKPRRRGAQKAEWDRKSVVRYRFQPDIPDALWKPWEVLKELRKIETERFPISAAALFRVFFELSTKTYMKRHRITDTREMHKNALAVAQHMRAHGRIDEGELTAASRRFKDKSQAEALLQYASLNDFMHSFKHMPDRQSVHVLWMEVEAYLDACWDDTRRPH